jgi:ribosomal protein L7Ae-like RNA K-turn-binding protein
LETDNRLLNLLGIARRAGRLEFGSEAVRQAVRRRRARLVLFAADFSPGSAEKIGAEAKKAGVRTARIHAEMDAVEAALGKRTGVISVNDTGFAKKLLELGAEERGGMNL